jgi:small-conductance mechanosensitive channel
MSILSTIRSYLVGVIVSLLTVLLLYIVKDYPCLRGSGLAMADSEAFLLSVFIALPSLVWALWKIIHYWRNRTTDQTEGKFIVYLATFTLIGVVIFLVLAILLIFFTSRFPIRFICEQPLLQWMFAYPM